MSKPNIITEPDPILRKSEVIEKIDDELKDLLNNIETMYDAPGIGLAAVQIGILKRIVVKIDISPEIDSVPLLKK